LRDVVAGTAVGDQSLMLNDAGGLLCRSVVQ
jgi:hypothetical protein